MLLVWVVELFILFKGLKVYGKVAYFITLSPYFVLTAFLVYALTGSRSEGAMDGNVAVQKQHEGHSAE